MTYNLCKRIIESETYKSKEDMVVKLDVFLLNDRIVQEEYNKLVELLQLS